MKYPTKEDLVYLAALGYYLILTKPAWMDVAIVLVAATASIISNVVSFIESKKSLSEAKLESLSRKVDEITDDVNKLKFNNR